MLAIAAAKVIVFAVIASDLQAFIAGLYALQFGLLGTRKDVQDLLDSKKGDVLHWAASRKLTGCAVAPGVVVVPQEVNPSILGHELGHVANGDLSKLHRKIGYRISASYRLRRERKAWEWAEATPCANVDPDLRATALGSYLLATPAFWIKMILKNGRRSMDWDVIEAEISRQMDGKFDMDRLQEEDTEAVQRWFDGWMNDFGVEDWDTWFNGWMKRVMKNLKLWEAKKGLYRLVRG